MTTQGARTFISRAVAALIGPASAGAAEAPLLETLANRTSVYVHAEVVVERRLLHSAPMRLFQEFPPVADIDGAMVITHGEPAPVRVERGGAVLEGFSQTHSLFPERSGALVIPGAEVTVGTRGSRSRAERVATPPLIVEVRPVPDAFPVNSAWFPAEDVSLTDTWTPADGHAVGAPIRRELVVRAVGTTGSAIPPLTALLPRAFRGYPEPASLGERIVDGTVVGARTELRAVIPTAPGAVVIPGVEIVWWNTRTDTLATTAVPVRRIAVTGGAPPAPAPVDANPAAAPVETAAGEARTTTPPALLAGTALAGAVGWFWALWLWRGRRGSRDATPAARPAVSLEALARRCQGRPPAAAKGAVLDWLADRWHASPPAVVRRLTGSAAGRALLDAFNDAIYARKPARMPAIEPMLAALLDDAAAAPESPLPPLYGADGAAAPQGAVTPAPCPAPRRHPPTAPPARSRPGHRA